MTTRRSDPRVRRWCRELEERLRAGTPCRAEDYLAAAGGLDPEDALELVYAEFVCREELGDAPSPDEYLARFPDLSGPLREQFLVHRALHDAAPATPASGQAVGPYELVREIGRGGRGVVYAARDRRDGRTVALKLLLSGEYSTPDELALFRHEAAVLARLDHPNLIRIHEAGAADGRPYLALECVEGPTLAGRLADYRSPADAAALVETLARAVHHAHLQGVVHRDLKPSNVLLAEDGRRQMAEGSEETKPCLPLPSAICHLPSIPKVTDFGLARVLDAAGGRTRTGDIVGTLGYMAPEQAAGTAHRAGPPADVYALGAILYELLTGRTPFGPEPSAQTIYRLLHEPPVPPRRLVPGLPRDLDTVCLACLEKSPDRRYPSALALADDLRRFLDGRPVSARSAGPATRAARWAWRRPAVAALVAVVALAGAGLTAGSLYYNARLGAALVEAGELQEQTNRANHELQAAVTVAETLRAEARRQKVVVEQRLDDTRRALFALQLSQLPALARREPVRARGLLADARVCPPDLRDFTWRYFTRLCGLDERSYAAHAGDVVALAYLPGGRLATGGADGRLRLWKPAGRGAPGPGVLAHRGGVTGVAALPGGLIATAGRDLTLALWRANHLREPVLRAETDALANALAASADGALLATAHDRGTVRLWSAADLSPRGHTPPGGGNVLAVAFAADGRLAWGDDDGRVRVAAAGSTAAAVAWQAHARAVLAVAFSPDGQSLATGAEGTGTEQGEAALWDPAAGTRRRRLSGHLFPVRGVAFDPAGRLLATGGQDSYLKLWDAAEGVELTNIMLTRVNATAFSPDGRWVALGMSTGKAHAVRVPPPEPTPDYPHPAVVASVAALPGGVVTGDAAGELRVWAGGTPARVRASGAAVRALAASPDGSVLAAGAENDVLLTDAAGNELARLRGHAGRVTAAAFGPGGTLLATGGEDRAVIVWDVAARSAVKTLSRHTDAVEAVAFAPDGSRLASASDDKTVRVWDGPDWTSRPPLKGHKGWVLSAAFHPCGRWLATGGRDREVRVWDLEDPSAGPRVLSGFTNWVYAVAYAPDGRTLAAASGHYSIDSPGELKLYDPDRGYLRAILSDYRAPLAFAADGSRLYAGVRGGLAALDAGPTPPG